MMIIPWQQINSETLNNLIESFVLREGTDYGEQEFLLAQKVADVRHQLSNGEAVVIWSELHETINIMPRTKIKRSTDSTNSTASDDNAESS
ncbi:UPF0270 protein [Candidatus Regiella insecticola]|uniref:UPF0270 protein RINTU1_06230 n=2 Tax=Candidatus Regiella insecticola TaxID=138073 RepID=A0A6L2ZLR2_9ENTR|nr:UPF0270 protein [Candidatus Regiella insecticola]